MVRKSILTFLTFAALASGATGASKDTEMILAELRALGAQISQIQRAQADLERAVQQLATTVSAEQTSVRKALVDSQTTVDDMKESLSVLSSKVDETNTRLRNVGQELLAMRQMQPIVIPPTPPEPTAAPVEKPGTAPPPTRSAAPGMGSAPVLPPAAATVPFTADQLYNQAYADYTQARYALAISGFKEVISRFPASDYSDNAQYWIGNSFLEQRKYKEALEAFDAVISLYPMSNKLDVAHLKKAYALEGLGSRNDAIRQFDLTIEKFPKSEAARVAKERLRGLRQEEDHARDQ